MSKGRFTKKKKAPIGLIAVLAIVLVGLLVCVWYLGNNQPGQPDSGDAGAAVSGQPDDSAKPQNTATQAPGTQDTGGGDNQDADVQQTEPSGTMTTPSQEATNPPQEATNPPQETTNPPQETTNPPQETTAPSPEDIETQPPVEIIEQKKADYERWLASAMIMGITMEYPDFEITGIYLASETTMDNKMDSKGCYILFNSAGTAMALHGVPLTGERTEAGTTEISSQIIGFASFDVVDPASVNTASMIQVNLEELSDLISQSMLVSIYAS